MEPEDCKHETLEPKQHPDGPIAPACVECGKFVVRGELRIVMPLEGVTTDGE